jgi:hypothetical protein
MIHCGIICPCSRASDAYGSRGSNGVDTAFASLARMYLPLLTELLQQVNVHLFLHAAHLTHLVCMLMHRGRVGNCHIA